MTELNNQLDLSINALENLNIRDAIFSEYDLECLKLITLNKLFDNSRFFCENADLDVKNADLDVKNDDLDVKNNDLDVKNDDLDYEINTETINTETINTQNYIPIYQVYLNRYEQDQLEYMKNDTSFCFSDYSDWYFNVVEDRREEGRLIVCKKYKTK
jgi:hypothetical protein